MSGFLLDTNVVSELTKLTIRNFKRIERLAGRENTMIRLLTARVRTGLVVAAMVATVPMITFAQTTEPAIESTPAAATAAEVNTSPTGNQNDTSVKRPTVPALVEVELQRRFNELRRELLDDRAKLVDWWLVAIAIVLTFFGIVVAIAGFMGFRRFREIETEAKNSVKTVTDLAGSC